MDLKELILYRCEVNRELTHEEVDNNFKKVANPWVLGDSYYSQDFVLYYDGNSLSFYMYYSDTDEAAPKENFNTDNPAANPYTGNSGWIKLSGGGGMGPQGPAGNDGEDGMQGIQGTDGMQGFQGIQGIQGIQG